MRTDHCEELLDAYVDDELAPDVAMTVARHLSECDGCSRAYEAVLGTVAVLRRGLVRQPAPDVLRARVREAVRRAAADGLDAPLAEQAAAGVAPGVADGRTPVGAAGRTRWWRGVAAAAVLVGVAATGSALTVLVGSRGASRPGLEAEVVSSHIRSLMPGHLTDVRSGDGHDVKPWFNGRVPFSPTVVRLDDTGFPLIGGRLDYVAGRVVAVVVYARRKHVINVFAWPAEGPDTRVELASENGYHVLSWRGGGAEHRAVSDLNLPELREFAAMYRAAEAAAVGPERYPPEDSGSGG